MITLLNKSDLRRQYLSRLRSLETAERDRASGDIVNALIGLDQLTQASSVACYCAQSFEIILDRYMDFALNTGKRVYCPRYDKSSDRYELAEITDRIRDLKPGHLDIYEPVADCPTLDPGLRTGVAAILIPALALTPNGHRLGRGRGYYDRLLRGIDGIKIGIAHELQIIDALPVEPHDIQVDVVVTDRRVIKCHGSK